MPRERPVRGSPFECPPGALRPRGVTLSARARRFAIVASTALAVVLGGVSTAAAQRGAGRALDDPTGQAPVQPRPAEPPTPPAPTEYDEGFGEQAVPAPPGGGYQLQPGVQPGATPIDRRTRVLLGALDATWQVLGARGGPNWFGGIVGILGGGLQIGLGAVFLEIDPMGAGGFISPYLITLGVTTVVRSTLIDLILAPDPRPTAIRYATMSSDTPEDAQARLEFGERELEALAEYSMIVRIIDASLSLAGALAVIPAYLVPRDWMLVSELEALVFLGPAISTIFAIVTLASPSPAEQRWGAYAQMRETLDSERGGGVALSPGFSIDPRGGGGFATLTGRF